MQLHLINYSFIKADWCGRKFKRIRRYIGVPVTCTIIIF
ncbi:hypothetical protein Nizo1838_1717 [Lactiplantibacillus plantarum]|nr:hypothetical protein Nizo1838_1717 [Lactiplantibacillus plantarum]KZT86916.1 hypothetical protein Nizo2256_2406 [Lactiplantibacillus plantarum]KZU45875.1 hypothetical protein Nizo2757_1100 [Lactiplantibacillus plantarum]